MQTQNRHNLYLTKYLESYQTVKPSFINLPLNPIDMLLNVQLWIFSAGLAGGLGRWFVTKALTTYKPLEVAASGGLIGVIFSLIFWFLWTQYPDKQKVLFFRLSLLAIGITIGSY